jgi:hypothetical protein
MSYSPGRLVSRWYIITGTIPSSFAWNVAGPGGLGLGNGERGVGVGVGVVRVVGEAGPDGLAGGVDPGDGERGEPREQPLARAAAELPAAPSSRVRRVSGWSGTRSFTWTGRG